MDSKEIYTNSLEVNEIEGDTKPIDLDVNIGGEVGKIEEIQADDTSVLITGRSVGEEIENSPIEFTEDIKISETDNKIDFQQYSLKNVKEAVDDYDVLVKKQLDEYSPVIGAGTITTEKIAASAITTEKIADNAITTNKITDNAITTDKIAASAITTDKIADNAIKSGKIESSTYTDGQSIKIGTWIDGKPIYRKTRHVDVTTTGSETSFSIGDSDSTAILWFEGRFNKSSGSVIPLNFYHLTVPSLSSMAFASSATQINYLAPSGTTSLDAVIYYTKAS